MADPASTTKTTSVSFSGFTGWIANEWQTQTTSEAAKTTYGVVTGWVYDSLAKAVTTPTGWSAPFGGKADH